MYVCGPVAALMKSNLKFILSKKGNNRVLLYSRNPFARQRYTWQRTHVIAAKAEKCSENHKSN